MALTEQSQSAESLHFWTLAALSLTSGGVGVLVETRDRNGQTPLFYAMESGVLPAAQALLVARAGLTARNSGNGTSAWEREAYPLDSQRQRKCF